MAFNVAGTRSQRYTDLAMSWERQEEDYDYAAWFYWRAVVARWEVAA